MVSFAGKHQNLDVSKFVTFKNYVKVAEIKFQNETIRWQISKYTKAACIFTLALTNSDVNVSNLFTFKKSANVSELNLRSEAIRWQISKSTKVVPCICTLALTISDMLTFQIFYLRKLGQGHVVHFSQ